MTARKLARTAAIVVDASVLLKTVIHEPESDDVTSALSHAARANVSLLVVPLARYEVGNVLVKAARRAQAKVGGDEIEALVAHALTLVDERFARKAAQTAIEHSLSYYDASYLALALGAKDTKLWTFDAKLGKAAEAENLRITTQEILQY